MVNIDVLDADKLTVNLYLNDKFPFILAHKKEPNLEDYIIEINENNIPESFINFNNFNLFLYDNKEIPEEIDYLPDVHATYITTSELEKSFLKENMNLGIDYFRKNIILD
tara:strand:+ start:117 stop:446 length:330 start_codon:yes stop_codon:yes gene_type:complete